jgi:hypothetical protein
MTVRSWLPPVAVLVVSSGLALASLATAPGVTGRTAQFTATIPHVALALMIIPLAGLNWFLPRTSLANLVALLIPVWTECVVAVRRYSEAGFDATPDVAWAGVVTGVAIFLAAAGWVGGRLRRGAGEGLPEGGVARWFPIR